MRIFGELAAGNPVLIGYLAYIAGLLIAIAAAKAAEAPIDNQRPASNTAYRRRQRSP
jgi:hypothetical protein